MGLGGYLTLTALARELKQRHPRRKIAFATRPTWRQRLRLRRYGKPVDTEIFLNNPNITDARTVRWFDNVQFVYLGEDGPGYWTEVTAERIVYKTGGHIIEHLCAEFGIDTPKLKCDLFLTDAEQAKARDIAQEIGPFLAIEPNTKDEFTPNKAWPFTLWQEVAAELSRDFRLVQLGAGSQPILDGVLDWTGRLSFRETAALLAHARLLLAPEGGLMHAANAVGIPAVIVFGGYIDPALSGYPGQECLYTPLDCAPCGLRVECPIGRPCLSAITPSQVIEAARRLLAGQDSSCSTA